uniref:Ribonuclease H-like domain-containing protein n=1 Tax=Tanacetum cinerariifolium TaxID=118510 RepID=A0A6L2MCI1_TANCI|nr:ribonuclease H-like domain-containing protein [Tanacetum cinerariifolium]
MIFNNSVSVVISVGARTRLFNLVEYINTLGWNRLAFYNNSDDDDVDYTIAITPILSTEEPDNSLSMGDEHLDTILATKSDEVIKSSVEDLVPIPSESEGIPDTMCDVHLVNNPTPLEAKDHFKIVINSNDDYYSSSDDDFLYNENIEYVEASPHDSELVSLEVAEIVIPEDEEIVNDNLREKLLNVNRLIAKIEELKDNPTPSSKFLIKSSSISPKSFLEETNTFDNSLPEFENFCFDLEEISSGSTTTHSDISLPDYEAFYFYDDHVKEISSGSTTTHSNISLSEYDSFIFDLSNDQFPPTNRSDFTNEEFADELAHIISPPEYDCFYIRNLPNQGEWIFILNFGIHENPSSTTRVNLPVEDDHSPLLAYVVWIFLAYLTYPIIPPDLHSFGNEDTIFNPGIAINRFYSFKPGLSHRCGTFKKFNTHRSHLSESLMEMITRIVKSFVLSVFHSQELHILSFILEIQVLLNKSQHKTPYELFNSRTPAIGYLRPFGCHVMILNTLNHLGKFDAKGDEGYSVGYSMSSKAFRVFNKRTEKVEENLHVDFLKKKLIEKGAGPNWLFDIDTLTHSMNYVPVVVIGKSSTNISGTKDAASQAMKKDVSSLRYIALPNWFHEAHLESSNIDAQDACHADVPESKPKKIFDALKDPCWVASPTPTFRIHKDHPKSQIIGPMDTPVQTKHKSNEMEEHSFIATIHQKTTLDLLQFCLFSCFLSHEEPKKIFDALKDPCWVEAMQEELLQFKIQNV